ncbi:SOS response-associated peptidase [Aneurinibacillus sp. Ricciae_BoGa-3]|uniref:SOS response-associated peptidase n=1 Tax=Aneurinibacillus sp. Ricciae_BoGa-3 TaxID=3022697 RepID=UPI0023425A95|nr:SOS response-associated peptidase [Aneurinibacillus sp. Ricciae_BoGa-3]WCK55175.1 SOS response-associated peptidase [Aneurinibacillus sp. Ricciae_BoGa-3]
MCGRFTLTTPLDVLLDRFQATTAIEDYTPRYNIAPSQQILTLINNGKENRLGYLKWGLIPYWAQDPKIAYKMINARAESIDQKPSYKHSFKNKRCLVIADSFYEWKREDGKKSPHRIRLKSEQPFAFAGLWDKWVSGDGEPVYSCTIITTKPNDLMASIHDRMPVILTKQQEKIWLDRDVKDTDLLKRFLVPYDAKEMEAYQVSNLVNSPKNEVAECLLPINSL